MLGRRVLFDGNEHIKTTSKGRDANLLQKRNKCIVYRYYMYNVHSRMSYEVIIETISEEFYLKPRTVINVLTAHSNDLKIIRKEEKPDLRYLSKQYPQLDWSIKAVDMK